MGDNGRVGDNVRFGLVDLIKVKKILVRRGVFGLKGVLIEFAF